MFRVSSLFWPKIVSFHVKIDILYYELFGSKTEDIFSTVLTTQSAQLEPRTGFIVLGMYKIDSSLHFHHLFPNEPMHHVWHIEVMLPWPCFST